MGLRRSSFFCSIGRRTSPPTWFQFTTPIVIFTKTTSSMHFKITRLREAIEHPKNDLLRAFCGALEHRGGGGGGGGGNTTCSMWCWHEMVGVIAHGLIDRPKNELLRTYDALTISGYPSLVHVMSKVFWKAPIGQKSPDTSAIADHPIHQLLH